MLFRSMLLLPGSAWDAQLLEWCSLRNSTVVALGADVPDAEFVLRFHGDEDDDVRLLSESLVCEVIAQNEWARLTSGD